MSPKKVKRICFLFLLPKAQEIWYTRFAQMCQVASPWWDLTANKWIAFPETWNSWAICIPQNLNTKADPSVLLISVAGGSREQFKISLKWLAACLGDTELGDTELQVELPFSFFKHCQDVTL